MDLRIAKKTDLILSKRLSVKAKAPLLTIITVCLPLCT